MTQQKVVVLPKCINFKWQQTVLSESCEKSPNIANTFGKKKPICIEIR